MSNTAYFFNSPARAFEESFPLGNGKHGALVYGGLDTERIVINDDTFYSGAPEDLSRFAGGEKARVWKAARELIFDGKLDEASDLLENDFNEYTSQKYLPIGDLYINFGHDGAENYKRVLDLENGVATVDYDFRGTHYTRTVFTPASEDAIIVNLSASEAKKISFTLDFKTENTPIDRYADGFNLITVAQAPYGYDQTRSMKQDPIFYRSTKEGDSIRFALSVIPSAKGGEVYTNADGITVKSADEVTLFIYCRTSYIDPYTAPIADCVSEVKAVKEVDFKTALARHREEFSTFFNRASLSLGGGEKNIDQLERLKSFDGSDLGLYELLFNFGRYLTISGSRAGSKATNLQGIWNHTMNPPWESTYTMNINLEMNYWPTLVTNLHECYSPLVDYLKSTMAAGRTVAHDFYGARGFVIHPNSDIWAHAVPLGKGGKYSAQYSPWPFASGWLAEQIYDGYEYTLNEDYLRDIFPILKEASLFYLDLLTEHGGALVAAPATSPENTYKMPFGRERFAVAKSTAITQSIIKELFTHTKDAAKILGIKDGEIDEISAALPKLKGLDIGEDGRLLEWDGDYEETDKIHRHVSHLYALYPATEVMHENRETLTEACKRSLIARTDVGTGWSLGWKINLWAILGDGDHAETMIKNQLRLIDVSEDMDYHYGGTYPNMLDAHPPFQIDGNYGATSGIANMLLQSKIGEITLLPALPSDWRSGSFDGFVAKGAVTVGAAWNDGRLKSATFVSEKAQKITVKYEDKSRALELKAGEALTITFA